MRTLFLKAVIAFCFPLSLVVVSCNSLNKEKEKKSDKTKTTESNSTPASGSGKFDITAPEGWTKKDTTAMGSRTVLLLSPLEGAYDDFMENVNVVYENAGSMSLDNYTDLSRSNLAKMLLNYTERGNSETTIDGLPARWVDYSHTMSGYDIDGRAYFLIKDNTAYVITTTTKKGLQDKWQTKFDEVVNSFHLN